MKSLFLALGLSLAASLASAGTLTISASENASGDAVLTGTGMLDLSAYFAVIPSNPGPFSTVSFGTDPSGTSIIYNFDGLTVAYITTTPINAPDISTDTSGLNVLSTGFSGDTFGFAQTSTATVFLLDPGANASGTINFTSTYAGLSLADLAPNYGTLFDDGTNKLVLQDATAAAIPLPATGWLLLAGVGGLMALRRSKRA